MDAAQKLQLLRDIVKKHGLAGYLQPVHDEYLAEYPPPCHRRVEWLSEFSGSAGTVAVLENKAALFVDGRYTLQAERETDGALFERHNIAILTPESWLAGQLRRGERVGYDPRLYTQSMVKRMSRTLAKPGAELVPCPNLVDMVWEDRPPAPATPLFIHELKYAGESSQDKRRNIASQLKTAHADAAVLAAPDAVCWLLNIRARDTEHTPLVLATAIIDSSAHVQLYVVPSRCNDAVRAHLGKEVELLDPARLEAGLMALGRKKQRVLCDPASAPMWFTQVLQQAGAQIVEAPEPCLLPKACKNDTELQGIRNAHIRDGAAVAKLLCWLDVETAKRDVRELEVSDKLLGFRAAHPMFVEPSFTTIAGSGPHGAIVHYRATETTNRILQRGELFLLDSGGQYPDGTTDITRTVPVGLPSPEQRDRFTRVLKGHIAIATARFPEGTSGSQLDALARQYLWQAGIDYDHGTGHGVGCFLGVHEGPQRIAKRGGDAALKPGMIISNEPGYYKAGAFGIRIENLVSVVPPDKGFLTFETLTCAPIDTRLVDAAMLSPEEKQWLNGYHAWVLESLSPLLDENERQWLAVRCAPV